MDLIQINFTCPVFKITWCCKFLLQHAVETQLLLHCNGREGEL